MLSQPLGCFGTVYCTVQGTMQCTVDCTLKCSVQHRCVGCPDTHWVVTKPNMHLYFGNSATKPHNTRHIYSDKRDNEVITKTWCPASKLTLYVPSSGFWSI